MGVFSRRAAAVLLSGVGSRVRVLARVGAVLGLAAAWSCAPDPIDPARSVSQPRHRFAPGPDATRAPPTATLLDDTRPVLRGPGRVDLHTPRAPVGEDGVLRVEAALPPSYGGVTHALGEVVLFAGQQRHPLPRRMHPLVKRGGGRALVLSVPLPPELAGAERVGFRLRGIGVPESPETVVETAPFEIPQDARLEFAFGVLEPEFADGPLAFEISICRGRDCDSLFEETLDPARPEQRGWQDRSIALGPAGERRRLRFTTRRVGEARTSLPTWGNPTVYAPASRAPDAHNVILISIDTLRADHLPSYGYRRNTAPFVEEHFARGGVLFEHPVAASAVTAPSHMTMFTGLQPSGHGVVDGLRSLSPSIPTLPEKLRAAGISTAAFTEDGWVGVHQGFARGFDSFVENKSAEIMVPQGQVDVTFGQARRWLQRNRDKRFFLFLHTYQVHEPYAPPPRYAQLFAETGAAAPPHLRAMADYDREIRYVDDELRALVATLEKTGLAERTVLVLTADHGEEFLEHGLTSHGGHLYEESVRVPLLLRGPGLPAGLRVATPVAQADLMPTILELFGLAPPGDRDARSFLPLALGGDPAGFEARPLFSEGLVNYQPGAAGGRSFDPPTSALRVGTRKLHRDREKGEVRYELYDLAEDPGERRNLLAGGADHPAGLEALVEQLDGYLELREAERRRLTGTSHGDEETPPLDPERREKLRALGYLE